MNRFRTKVKKKFTHDKSNSDVSSMKPWPTVVGAGSGSQAYLGITSKDTKRKAVSVSGPPDVSSPVHQVSKVPHCDN